MLLQKAMGLLSRPDDRARANRSGKRRSKTSKEKSPQPPHRIQGIVTIIP